MLRRAERNQEGSGSSSRIYPEAKRISQDKAWHATPDPAAPCVWSGSEAVEHGLEKAPQLLLFELIDANGDGHVKPSEAALFLDTLLSASRREGAPPLAPLVEEIAARVCADAAAAAAATDEASKQQSLQPSEQGQQPQQEPGQGLFLTPALLGRCAPATVRVPYPYMHGGRLRAHARYPAHSTRRPLRCCSTPHYHTGSQPPAAALRRSKRTCPCTAPSRPLHCCTALWTWLPGQYEQVVGQTAADNGIAGTPGGFESLCAGAPGVPSPTPSGMLEGQGS